MKSGCPTEEQIADYLEDRTSEAQRIDVEGHLARCESCFEEFACYRSVVRGGESTPDQVPESVTLHTLDRLEQKGLLRLRPFKLPTAGGVRDLCRRMVGYLGFSHSSAALAPIRGSKRVVKEGFVEIRKTFQDLSTVIEIEKIPHHKVNIRVSFPGDDNEGGFIRTTLVKDGRYVTSLLCAPTEPVVFDEVPFGVYALSFSRGGTLAGEYHFEIKD